MIVSLDLISGLISSIPVRHMEALIEESHLVHLLLRCAAVSSHIHSIDHFYFTSIILIYQFFTGSDA